MMRKIPNHELDRKSLQEFQEAATSSPFTLVLDSVRSAYNVGSIFRTSDAFLVERIYLCGISARPPHKEIRKTALGASDSVAWEHEQEILSVVEKLKNKGYQIIAIEQAEGSISLQDFEVQTDQKYALVFGHEVMGVSQEVMNLVDACIEIPQWGTKHSLNISVSVGVVLWDLGMKFRKL